MPIKIKQSVSQTVKNWSLESFYPKIWMAYILD
jgi:hypothetical protein